MAAARVERRLAAILAADIVGYSRLVERDEAGTLAAIKALRREVIDPLLAEHHGRIVKLMGDGAIVEFGSVVDAVACAVAVQRASAERQAERAADRRIVLPHRRQSRRRRGRRRRPARRRGQRRRPAGAALRAGRRAGLGHAPTTSSRASSTSPSSRRARQRLKNISEPVRVYRVRMAPAAVGEAASTSGRAAPTWRWVAAGVADAARPGRPCGLAAAVAADRRGGVRSSAWPFPCRTSLRSRCCRSRT